MYSSVTSNVEIKRYRSNSSPPRSGSRGWGGWGRITTYVPAQLLSLARRPLDVGRRFAALRVPQHLSVGPLTFRSICRRCRHVPCPARPARLCGIGRDRRASSRPGPPGPDPPDQPATSAPSARSGVARAGCGSPGRALTACPPAACATRPTTLVFVLIDRAGLLFRLRLARLSCGSGTSAHRGANAR